MKHLDFAHVAALPQLTDYDEIAEVLRSRKFVQGAYETSGSEFMGGTLSAIDGEQHLARRRVLAQLFSDEAVAVYKDSHVTPAIDLCLRELFAGPRDAQGQVHCDLVALSERCHYRVAGAITGIDGLADAGAADRFIAQIQAIASGLTLDWTREDPAQVSARARAAREAFRVEFFQPSCERRQRALGGERADMSRDALMLMLAHRHEGWPDDPDALLREVTLLLTAATQSASAALVHFFVRLEQWLGAHPEDRPAIAADPQFLRKAAVESMRLTSGAPARIRKATEDVQLSTGRVVKTGERVALLLVASNKEADRFGPDADQFNPHREAHDAPPWGHAFGGGAHMCLGRPLMTGSRIAGRSDVDGIMVAIARRLYAAGIRLDASRQAVHDQSTFYDVYTALPVVLTPS
ncbi:MAG TPA: cytochrome P450 [Ramlibacter sp.]|nr:cytochrome P450 [Ramlibacter sp.]